MNVNCKDCGVKLKVNTNVMLCSWPPKYIAECPNCNMETYVEVEEYRIALETDSYEETYDDNKLNYQEQEDYIEGSLNEYIVSYNIPYVACEYDKVLAHNVDEAKEKFMKHHGVSQDDIWWVVCIPAFALTEVIE